MTGRKDEYARAADAERARQLSISLTNWPIESDQVIADIEELRGLAKVFGQQLIAACPDSRERSLAITHLEDAVMWAIKSLVIPR